MPAPRTTSDASTVINRVTVHDPNQHSSPDERVKPRQDFSNERISKHESRLGDYLLGQTIGVGEFAKVKLGWKKQSNVQVAVKLIKRQKLKDQDKLQKIYREVTILKQCDHPNIVRLYEMVETERTIGIILELAPGGELYDYISVRRRLLEPAARRFFAQLVSGVGYLHKKGIIHRDLKLENLMLDRNNNIIITDFGFANTFDPNDELGEDIESRLHDKNFVKKHKLDTIRANGFRRGDLMSTSCGSPCYAAPELVFSDTVYNARKVDVWSCGVILFAMLAGYLPYDEEDGPDEDNEDDDNPEGNENGDDEYNEKKKKENTNSGNINLLYRRIVEKPLHIPKEITPHARDLIRRIIVPDPRKRADLFEVARHSWLSDYAHLVEFITSNNTSVADISNHGLDRPLGSPASKLSGGGLDREPVKPLQPIATISGLVGKHTTVDRTEEANKQPKTDRDTKRRTVQVEYVAPQTHNISSTQPSAAAGADIQATAPEHSARGVDIQTSTPSQQTTQPSQLYNAAQNMRSSQQSSTRPSQDPPRPTTDTTAFAPQTTRPSTQGSMTATSRLPSRGSYGQPAAATVATTSAQGRFAQPKAYTGIANQFDAMMGPAHGDATDSPSTLASSHQQILTGTNTRPRTHKRSNTLTSLGDKIFGRSNSTRKATEQRQKPDRAYPPTSMKPIQTENAPRQSTDSRRSFGFSRKSSDLAKKEKRTSRRFSFIPRWGSNNQADSLPSESTADEPTTPIAIQSNSNIQPHEPTSYSPYGYRDASHGSSEPAPPKPSIHSAPNFYPIQPVDRDGSTQAITPQGSAQTRGYPIHQSPNSFMASQQAHEPYQEKQYQPYMASNNPTRGDRRFSEQHDREDGNAGSSGAARRVMDFFRRRGKYRDYA